MLQAIPDWKAKLKAQLISDKMRRRAEIVRELEAHPTCKAICALVAEQYDLTFPDLRGRSRLARIVRVRRLAAIVCRRVLSASTGQIGRALNRDHSTIHHHLALSRTLEFDCSECASIEKIIHGVRNSQPVDNAHNCEKDYPSTNQLVHYDSQ